MDLQMTNIVHLSDLRWRVALGPSGWVIRDSWNPGDFCMGFKTEAEARAEANYRNNHRALPVLEGDDLDIPF
jgi:hypothetical protein